MYTRFSDYLSRSTSLQHRNKPHKKRGSNHYCNYNNYACNSELPCK